MAGGREQRSKSSPSRAAGDERPRETHQVGGRVVFLVGLAAAALVALVVWPRATDGAADPAPEPAAAAPSFDLTVTGVGEPSLIVVVSGTFDMEAAARSYRDELAALRDIEIAYVDASRNYELLGLYVDDAPAREGPVGGGLVAGLPRPQLVHHDVAEAMPPGCGAATELAPPGCPHPDALRYATDGLPDDEWWVLSAFRTRAGAEEYVELVEALGADPFALRVRKLDGPYVGLGQEAHPDGSGPLVAPLEDQVEYQR